MNVHTFKSFFLTLAIICGLQTAYAQFDDVYYDPDLADMDGTTYDDEAYTSDEDGVTYYDNDEYTYYDDYDYYYTSRVRRFHNSYRGFGFYDPVYTSYNYYDPYYMDSYSYPGSSIYISLGNDYHSYRNWRRWNRFNQWNNYSNWGGYYSPASYYYSYNSWCAPSNNYWGGYNGYHSYSNYYNNYYNNCPSPISNYYGINHTTVHNVNNGIDRGSYYGPRTTGNTGSSPRGTINNPGSVQPVLKGSDRGVTQSNDTPKSGDVITTPGRVNSSTPALRPDANNSPNSPVERGDKQDGVVKQVPVDKELPRSEAGNKRPVFKPESDQYKPNPGTENPRSNTSERVPADKPVYRPYTPDTKPAAPSQGTYAPRNPSERSSTPTRDESKPSYTPPRETPSRPSYTPPPRNNDSERASERPSNTPPPRSSESERNNDRPSYNPPPRNNDSGRSSNSNERSSYSAPRSSGSSGNSGSSGGSSRSSGGSSNSNNNSPRSGGRG